MKKGRLTEKQFDKMLKDAFESCVVENPKADHACKYIARGFTTKNRTHTCLRWGYWCWKNLFEHPKDLLVYLRRKLTTKRR